MLIDLSFFKVATATQPNPMSIQPVRESTPLQPQLFYRNL